MVYFSICVVVDFFFHQYIIVVWVQVFCLLRYVYSWVFYSFCCRGKWDCFFNFSFWYFVVSVNECKRFLYLILYPATLPNSLIRSSSFLVASLEFSMHYITSSANSDSFTSYFPTWIPFLFLLWFQWLELPKLCWIILVWVSILVFFLILEKIFSFFTIFALVLSYMAFIMWRSFPLCSLSGEF